MILIQAIEKLLSDGQWHPITEFYAIGRELITPELACRAYRELFPEFDGESVPMDQVVSRGYRRVVQRKLQGMCRRKHVENNGGRGLKRCYRKVSK